MLVRLPSLARCHMLTPMLVQYLVGLCCLRRNPTAVDITIGGMVLDESAEKERDVDVTVTLEEAPGTIRAFKAYEVKKEKTPLDVAEVEQLCMKLHDMPSVTHKAIVSSSGFTSPALKKANHHGVELFSMQPWAGRLEVDFPGLGMSGIPQECLRYGGQSLLYWVGVNLQLVTPSHPTPYSVQAGDPILLMNGDPHPKYATFDEYRDELMSRSTGILFQLEPAISVGRIFPVQRMDATSTISVTPPWPHTHSMDTTKDDAHIRVDGSVRKIEMVTISGKLQWQRKDDMPEYILLRNQSDGQPFAGAMVALGQREDEMIGIVLSPVSRTIGVHSVRLEEKHRNMIRKLKLITSDVAGSD
jgi:Restriction endonuclease